jgi:excisionase family DNA binding protein
MHRKRFASATISIPEAAKLAGVGKSAIKAGITAGQIPAIPIGKRLRVLRVPFEELLTVGQTENGTPIEGGTGGGSA